MHSQLFLARLLLGLVDDQLAIVKVGGLETDGLENGWLANVSVSQIVVMGESART